MAGIKLDLDTQLNTDGQTTADQPQAQLKTEPVRSQPTNAMGVHNQDQHEANQDKYSEETMEHATLNSDSEAAVTNANNLGQAATTRTGEVVREKHLKEH
ncbi:hypothetical protein E3N88_23001 [Mikania micrantha]|uniref:Uncharacterized protein n=1 Tax=Mikania micrantha TaxID=192012 RepID=A0A5N6NDT2_9ASTR|nr:hypothetical protein E3N88_23001 [Mikania micrantha]